MALGSWAIVADAGGGQGGQDPRRHRLHAVPGPGRTASSTAVIAGDYKNAINIHSKHKAAARAWIDWFANNSNYATDQGGVSPLVEAGRRSGGLGDFTKQRAYLIELTPPPAGKESHASGASTKDSEIDLSHGPKNWQQLVDIARGAKRARPSTQLLRLLEQAVGRGSHPAVS